METVKELNIKLSQIFTEDNLLEYYNPILVEASKAQILPNLDDAFSLDPITGKVTQVKPIIENLENAVIVRMILGYTFIARLNMESDSIKIVTRLSPFFQASVNEIAKYRRDVTDNPFLKNTINFKFPGTKDIFRDMDNSVAVEFRLYMGPKEKDPI